MPNDRLTKRVGPYTCYTKGPYAETTAAEMSTSAMRDVLARLAEYEDACFDESGVERITPHDIHYMREIKKRGEENGRDRDQNRSGETPEDQNQG